MVRTEAPALGESRWQQLLLCLPFIHPPAHGSEVSPAARNTLDSARIPRASKLLICGLFLKGRVLAQDGVANPDPSKTSCCIEQEARPRGLCTEWQERYYAGVGSFVKRVE